MQFNIDKSSLFKLSYGLFVLTAKENGKDNGCIINTVMQITDNPKRIIIGLNKANFTHDMIVNTGEFNISILTTETNFDIFERFGFASGRDTDKFNGFNAVKRSENGLLYTTDTTNAFISGKVVSSVDCGSHTLFVADITEGKTLSDKPSVTYQYYFDNIKPKPQNQNKKGFVCKICNYVYEGDVLPADFICPICKHGVEDFVPVQ